MNKAEAVVKYLQMNPFLEELLNPIIEVHKELDIDFEVKKMPLNSNARTINMPVQIGPVFTSYDSYQSIPTSPFSSDGIREVPLNKVTLASRCSQDYLLDYRPEQVGKQLREHFLDFTQRDLAWTKEISNDFCEYSENSTICITNPRFETSLDDLSLSYTFRCEFYIGVTMPKSIKDKLLNQVCKKCPQNLKCILKSKHNCKFYFIAKEVLKK